MGRKPNKKLKKSVPPSVAEVMNTQTYCPRNHLLPNHTPYGQCTPFYCAEQAADTAPTSSASRGSGPTHKTQRAIQKRISDEADKNIEATVRGNDDTARLLRTEAATSKAEEVVRTGRAVGRFAARLAALDVPTGLGGAEAEQWADKKLVELLPLAVAEKEYALKFGDDAQRERASSAILDATGRGKKDMAGLGGPAIILQVGPSGTIELPWARRVDAVPAALPATPEKAE